jgi:2-polyprenyl-3-methyl-5-hydroxy-6-metoxy-1,4-benzoquinol methylase
MFTALFAASGARVVAVDISPELVRIAQARDLPAERVHFVVKRVDECALDGPFDAVVGSSVLHHLDMDRSLPIVRELLRPGGRLAFAEPNYLNPQVCAERALRFLPVFSYVARDETAFLRWRLADRLSAAGFVGVSVLPFDWLHPRTPRRWIAAVSSMGMRIERIPLLREFAGSLLISARCPGEANAGGCIGQ